MLMDIALYQPEIAGNLGTILRTCACFDVGAHIIEPCGFPFSDRKFKRAGMDYYDKVRLERHADWDHFRQTCDSVPRRLILLTSKTRATHHEFSFRPDDILLFGSEGHGVPNNVRDDVDEQITIPMQNNMRSLNLAVSVGIALGEALRQTGQYP